MANTQEFDTASIAAAIAELGTLVTPALKRRWRTLVGGSMPADLGRPLTLRVLAYKLQAQQRGDLDRDSLRALAALYQDARGWADQEKAGSSGSCSKPIAAEAGGKPSAPASGSQGGPAPPRMARPGTLLVREHGGVLHRVMILDQGVTWNGRTYDSLSQVALAITGTKWNGPRFFGLRHNPEMSARTKGKLAVRSAAAISRGRAASAGRSSSQRASP